MAVRVDVDLNESRFLWETQSRLLKLFSFSNCLECIPLYRPCFMLHRLSYLTGHFIRRSSSTPIVMSRSIGLCRLAFIFPSRCMLHRPSYACWSLSTSSPQQSILSVSYPLSIDVEPCGVKARLGTCVRAGSYQLWWRLRTVRG